MSRGLQDRWHLSVGVNAALRIIGERAKPEKRAQLLGARDTLRQITGSGEAAREWASGRKPSYLREQLDQQEWDAAYRRGRSLSFDAVVTLTLDMLVDFSQLLDAPEITPEQLQENPLSEREQEVLRLVAEGLSSRAIGKQLFISTSTVNYHLTSAFNKLGVNTRAQAIAAAIQRNFL